MNTLHTRTGDCLEIECRYDFDPGEKGCRYTKNGDGWPDIEPSAELTEVLISGDDVPDLDILPYLPADMVADLEKECLEAHMNQFVQP